MAAICPKLVRGKMLRATRLDACGVPVTGATAFVTSSGFISVGLSPQYEDPENIVTKNANDQLCINEQGEAQLTSIDVELTFCAVDPDLFTLITGDPLVLDDTTPTPIDVGFRIREGITVNRFALEVWSDISGQVCTTTSRQYWYHLLPYLGNARWGDFSIENGAVTFAVTASTFAGSGWGVGPHNVINAGGPPAVPSKLLAAITGTDHYHGQVTTLAPPAAACGFQTLP